MSVQYGEWRFSQPIEERPNDRAEGGSDGVRADRHGFYANLCVAMGFDALDTTLEAEMENQPLRSDSGAVLTWDGRLDNREQLIGQLGFQPAHGRTDAEIVIAAYLRWGIDCLGRLLGDWALALWDPGSETLYLARDFAGTRPLFYRTEANGIRWSTMLEHLLAGDSPSQLDLGYLAGYFILSPPAELTPYEAIRQVPPSSVAAFTRERVVIRRYWNFQAGRRIAYQEDREYEDHFRELLTISVQRRLRSNAPVLAELSGGMDSTSIVCLADRLIADDAAALARLDTISYYDDLEPNWDERSYFSLVERNRGRQGIHLDVSGGFTFEPVHDPGMIFPVPPGLDESAMAFENRRRASMRQQGNRVLLSGIGGDEFLGGVPTPIPELADLLYQAQFPALLRAVKSWSLSRKEPFIHLLLETIRDFVPATISSLVRTRRIAPWLRKEFVRRHREAFLSGTSRSSLSGPRPSFRANCGALAAITRQLAAAPVTHADTYEIRYPYLDRDLLEFVFAIPREQVLRPGRRRSLMRRALKGIVPEAILERRRKAFVARSPLEALSRAEAAISRLTTNMLSEELGVIDRAAFLEALGRARQGREEPVVLILHTLGLEMWLRRIAQMQLIETADGGKSTAAVTKCARVEVTRCGGGELRELRG